MKTYAVTIPFRGTAYLVVEAEDEKHAEELAKEQMTSDDFEGWEIDESRDTQVSDESPESE